MPPTPAPNSVLDSAAAPAWNVFPFSHNQTNLTVTTSSFPQGGTAAGKLRSYKMALMQRYWARHGSTTLSLVLTVGTRSTSTETVQHAVLIQDQGLKIQPSSRRTMTGMCDASIAALAAPLPVYPIAHTLRSSIPLSKTHFPIVSCVSSPVRVVSRHRKCTPGARLLL
jgi:hypothetical protein